MGKETEGYKEPRPPSTESGQESIINKDDFDFQQASVADTSRLQRFYNNVIEFNRQDPERILNWNPYAEDSMREVIERGEVFFVTSKPNRVTNMPEIVAAVMLDTNRDYGAWPEHEGILPERSIRFGKLATEPTLRGQNVGERVVWPLMLTHARSKGFEAIYCEAFPVEKLDSYYQGLGMTAHGEKTYRSAYYGRIITANRYSLDLRSSPKK